MKPEAGNKHSGAKPQGGQTGHGVESWEGGRAEWGSTFYPMLRIISSILKVKVSYYG